MEMEENKKQKAHPVIKKCMNHLEIIEASDKTKQIVYMYMKALDDEIAILKEKSSETGN